MSARAFPTKPGRRLGVCSWSLQPGSPAELVAGLEAVGVRAVQLALNPLRTGQWDASETRDRLAGGGFALASGMMSTVGEDYSTLETIRETGGIRPSRHWAENLRAARENAWLARDLGIPLVSLHAGFLPEEPYDPERAVLLVRMRELADAFAAEGVQVALETGQESSATLKAFLEELDHSAVGVNFDPANMILYDRGEPVEALRELAPWVRQIHVKDAARTRTPGTWGAEVPVGTGEVDWPAFFAVVRGSLPAVDLMIEREAGAERIADMRTARKLVEGFLA